MRRRFGFLLAVLVLVTLGDAATAVAQTADIAVTKTDGVANATAGGSVTYTITVSNPAGPNPAPITQVQDTFPAAIASVTWTCVGAGGGTCGIGAGAGNINQNVNLPVGASVTFTANATLDPGATGLLSNTATATTLGGVTDPTPANNSATDTDTIVGQANLAITKTDGSATEIPGTTVVYTITASNPAGPSDVTGATVADTFPASLSGVTWTCVGAGGGTCTAAGAGNISDNVDLPVGGSVTYTASATIDAAATGLLANTATVTVPGGVTDPNLANNSATDTDTLTPQANLGITKTDGSATEIPGTTVIYSITASNPAGPSDVTGATVTDNFPGSLSGITWTCAGAGGGTCTAAGAGNISDNVDLPVGGSVTYIVTATIASGALGTLNNTATVSVPGGVTDPNLANNSSTDSDTLTPQADLAIGKTDSVDPVVAGTNLTYDVTVTNNGPSDALGVVMLDTLPAQTVFVSAPGCSHDGSPTGGVVTCNIGTIVAAAAPVRSITVLVLSSVVDGATITNNASVSATTPDPGPSANATMIDTTVEREPDLGVSKVASVDPVIAGTNFTYTVTVDNNGPSDASLVEMTDTLPGEVTFVSAAGCTHDGSAFGGVVTCPIGDLVAGASVQFTIESTVEPCTPIGTIMTNDAEVTLNPVETDPGPTPNTFSLDTTVDTLADVSITKTGTPDPQYAGLNVTYTVTVANAGPSCAWDVNVLDTFAADMLFLDGMSDPSCTDNHTSADCAQGIMTPGQVNVLTLVGKVACSAADGSVQTNNVLASSSTADPNAANNTDSVDTTIETLAELRIDKSDAPDPVQPDSNLNYTIDVFNDGPSDALGVVVTDPLPNGLRFVSGTEGCVEIAGTVTCDVGTVPCGKRRQVRIRANVETDGSLSNTASVTTTTDETNPGDNSDTETTSIRSGGGVQMRLSGAPRALREGGVTTVVYLIRVRNKSLLDTTDVRVTNVLPGAVSFVEATPSPTSVSGSELVFDFASMAPFESRAILIKAELVGGTVPGTGLIDTATLTVGGDFVDEQSFSGFVRDPGPSRGGELRTQLTTVRRVLAGSKLTATIDILNTSRKEAQDVEVVMTVPANLELEFVLPEPASVTTVGDETMLVWELPSLRGPSNTRLKVVERVPLGITPGSSFDVSVSVSDADGRSATDQQSVEVRD